MKNIIKILALTLSVFALIVSCSEEDYTGQSTKKATSPSLSVELGFANSQSLVESETSFPFTVTISEPQIATVVIKIAQVGGSATDGDDFSIPHSVSIPVGSTSVSDVITIHADDLVEDTENAIIQIALGNEANVDPINSETVTFEILNVTDGDLAIGMSWATSLVTDDLGVEIEATDFADLRLLVSTGPNNTDVIGEADGGSFESFVFSSTEDDGEYYVVADFYTAVDIERDIDITLTFDQTGVINGQTHEFPGVLNNASVCDAYFAVLAKFTKTGDTYTFEEIGTNSFAVTPWSGTDAGYDSQITSSIDCTGSFLRGINAEWMFDFWGETIEEEGNVYYTVDGSGNVTIPSQYIFTTLYSGSNYDYTISGTGVIDGTGTLTLQYYLDQDGFDVSGWLLDNGYSTVPYFEAIITAD